MEILKRMLRASLLESNLYEEVEHDLDSNWQAFLVVLICALCSGIGGAGIVGMQGILSMFVFIIIGWIIWCLVIYIIGVKVFEYESDLGVLMRATAYASSPLVLTILGLIPGVGIYLRIGAYLWGLVAFVIAVRQALKCDTLWSIFIVVQGFIVYVIIFILIVLFKFLF